jgi:hypothetical protein
MPRYAARRKQRRTRAKGEIRNQLVGKMVIESASGGEMIEHAPACFVSHCFSPLPDRTQTAEPSPCMLEFREKKKQCPLSN